jgi:hypothetical protein
MGGELTARSVEGQGSTFTLSLPLYHTGDGAAVPTSVSEHRQVESL